MQIRSVSLATCIALCFTPALVSNALPPTTLTVTSCGDSGPGTLRSAIAQAGHGDKIDLTQLSCSTITLTTGAVTITQDKLDILGPGAANLEIRGPSRPRDRVLRQPGYGELRIDGITISSGYFSSDSDHQPTTGGCIESHGQLFLTNAVVTNCGVKSLTPPLGSDGPMFAAGGCIWAIHATLTDSLVTGCLANGYGLGNIGTGAGIYGGYVVLTRSTVSNSRAISTNGLSRGGGISASNLLLEYSSILDNEAQIGGGLWTEGSTTINASTIARNLATREAGGVYMNPRPFTASITNSTISGNTSMGYAAGMLTGYAIVSVRNSTITSNVAWLWSPIAGAGFTFLMDSANGHAPLLIESTIVANNSGNGLERDLGVGSGTLVTGGNNIFQYASGPISPGSFVRGCPQLGPLRDNGGPTPTHALLSNSLGLGAGANSANIVNDQRGPGYPRVRDSAPAPDVGAYESQVENIFSTSFDGCVLPL